ncbi:MAG: hypothetical protein ACI8RD_003965 [Bacillariaceae sp.]|jgi:hypothetical protein
MSTEIEKYASVICYIGLVEVGMLLSYIPMIDVILKIAKR